MAANVHNPTTSRGFHGLTRPQKKLPEAAASEICDTDIVDVGLTMSLQGSHVNSVQGTDIFDSFMVVYQVYEGCNVCRSCPRYI